VLLNAEGLALSSTSSSSMIQNLKLLRVQCGMTLETLADETNLTRSYLSKVERGLSNPSIGAAMSIARALGVSVERLFGQDAKEDPIRITRASRGKAGDPANYLSLLVGSTDKAMRAFVVRPSQKSGRSTIMSHHVGEEVLFVLSGTIEMQLGARREVLSSGDCVHFDSAIPHKLKSLSKDPASALVVIASTDR
jgi:transcriptional regulator with XRE-family HTH domain